MTSQRFPRIERLKSFKLIRSLFTVGSTHHVFPLRLHWVRNDDSPVAVQMAFSVPKRQFRLAVERNLIRRRIFEAYRKNKSAFIKTLEDADVSIAAMLVFSGKQIADYSEIENAMQKLLDSVAAKLTGSKKPSG